MGPIPGMVAVRKEECQKDVRKEGFSGLEAISSPVDGEDVPGMGGSPGGKAHALARTGKVVVTGEGTTRAQWWGYREGRNRRESSVRF